MLIPLGTKRGRRSPNPLGSGGGADDLIFEDSFESGDCSAWDSFVNPGGKASVTGAAALVGSYGFQLVADGSKKAGYVVCNMVNEPRVRVRYYFDPNSVAMVGGNDFYHILTWVTPGGKYAFATRFQYHASFGYRVHQWLRDDGNIYVPGVAHDVSDDVHIIEQDWCTASAPGANDGYLSLWIDDSLEETLSGLDTDASTIAKLDFGVAAGLDAGTIGTLYFDHFEARREHYIGP